MNSIFGREPVIIQTLVLAAINLAVVFNWVTVTPTQIAAINGAMAAVLGLIVRKVVTPLADPKMKFNGEMHELVRGPQKP